MINWCKYFLDKFEAAKMPKMVTLRRNYRNSLQITRLSRYLMLHDKHGQVGVSYIDGEREESDYPEGTMPVLVVKDRRISYEEALESLQRRQEYKERLKSGQFHAVSTDEDNVQNVYLIR